MNRNEEYLELLNTLGHTPKALDNTVEEGMKRARKAKTIKRFVTMPVASLAAVLAIFIGLVNVVPSFAAACGGIPFLSELAELVAFSPTLTEAVENKYVQYVGQEQTSNGITARIEALIVGYNQINVFFSLDTDRYQRVELFASLNDITKGWEIDESLEHNYSESDLAYIAEKRKTKFQGDFSAHFYGRNLDAEVQGLRRMHFDFEDGYAADDLLLYCVAYGEDGITPTGDEPTAMFTFLIELDPNYSSDAKIFKLHEDLDLNQQHITLATAEIYADYMCLNLDDDSENTAWLLDLGFYLKNDKGQQLYHVDNGSKEDATTLRTSFIPLTALTPFKHTYFLKNAALSKDDQLTVVITNAVLLNKDEYTKIDLVNQVAQQLPQGVTLKQAVKKDSDWELTFSVVRNGYTGINPYDLFDTTFYKTEGYGLRHVHDISFGVDPYDEDQVQADGNLPKSVVVTYTLKNYDHDIVYFPNKYSRIVTLDVPLEITLK